MKYSAEIASTSIKYTLLRMIFTMRFRSLHLPLIPSELTALLWISFRSEFDYEDLAEPSYSLGSLSLRWSSGDSSYLFLGIFSLMERYRSGVMKSAI